MLRRRDRFKDTWPANEKYAKINVTRWLEHLFNIGTFRTLKICPIELRFAEVGSKFHQFRQCDQIGRFLSDICERSHY